MFIDPLRVLRLAERIAPADGEIPLPALGQVILHVLALALDAAVGAGQQRGGAAGAELALAGTHPDARAPAQVRQVADVEPLDRGVNLPDGDLLTLANQGLVVAVAAAQALRPGPQAARGGFLDRIRILPDHLGHFPQRVCAGAPSRRPC